MYHQAISGFMHGWLRDGDAPSLDSAYAASIVGGAFLVSIAIAWLSLTYFEAYFLKIGSRQKYGADKALDSAATRVTPPASSLRSGQDSRRGHP
jgi:peptidoglycan/LPS O-acetylase OafA/YrhL